MKILCWIIVIAGWVLYGLMLVVQVFYMHEQADPIEDIQRFFTQSTWDHWQFNIVALTLVALYLSAWVYIQKDKEE